MVEKRKENDTESVTNKKDSSQYDVSTSITSNDPQNLRIILPAFIQNEKQHSQTTEFRQIHSSPTKSTRRFSQDSFTFSKQLTVSNNIFE